MTARFICVRFLSCTILVFLIALVTPTPAQSTKGTIKGTIRDPNGAVIPHATVTVVNAATNAERTVTASDDGTYEAPSLDPGTYSVTVKAGTFAETLQQNVVVQTATTKV